MRALGGALNVCAKCSAQVAGEAALCARCELGIRTVPRGIVWQRVITGVTALPLLVVGSILIKSYIDYEHDFTDADYHWTVRWGEGGPTGLSLILGGLPTLVGSLFMVGTLSPFTTFRHVLVTLGAGLLVGAAAFFAVLSSDLPSSFDAETISTTTQRLALVSGVLAFCFGSFLGYRLAR